MRVTDLAYSRVLEPPTSPPDDDPPPSPPVSLGAAPPSAETAGSTGAVSPPVGFRGRRNRDLAERAGLASVLRATELGATLLYAWVFWFRVYPATRWDAALPSRPSALCART
jgi:hypothetical protein